MSASKEQATENIKKAHNPEVQARAQATRKANVAFKHAVYDELKSLLSSGKKPGDTYYTEFINKFLKEALKNPNSKAGQMVASTVFQENMLSILDEQHEQEMAKDRDFLRYRLIKDFFHEQRDVILDTNHQKRMIACCSRRAGKTDLASGAICYAAIIPESRIIYINLTFTNAINQIWNNTIKRADECGLTITKSSKADGTIEFSNGSSLRIMGNPNNSEIEKLRGESKVSLIIIDEFFHQRNMQYAVDEVISPLMADRKDSTLLCMRTPPRLAHTYGEKCWNEKGWKKFHWTMFENPYMPDPQEYLEEYCKNKGIEIDSPFVQREYYGKIGCYDTEALVFKGRQTYNEYDVNTMLITDLAIGVDYGFSDYNSVITVGYNTKTKESWILKEDKFNKAGVSDIMACISRHYKYAMDVARTNRIVLDEHIKIYCDTNEQSITYDLITKYKLPAFNCYKYDKTYAIEMLAEELRTGRMKIPHNGILDQEMEQILYKRDEETDAIIPEIDEEIGIHPDAMMALLYASRKVFFDMDYQIDYKETQPQKSDYVVSDTGTIIEVADESSTGNFQDIGTIG